MVAQSPPLFLLFITQGGLWDMFAKEQTKEQRWLGLMLIELMVAMAVVAIATFTRASSCDYH